MLLRKPIILARLYSDRRSIRERVSDWVALLLLVTKMKSPVDSAESSFFDKRAFLISLAAVGVLLYSVQSSMCPTAHPAVGASSGVCRTVEFFRKALNPSKPSILFCSAAVHDRTQRIRFEDRARSEQRVAEERLRSDGIGEDYVFASKYSRERPPSLFNLSRRGAPRRLSGLVGRTLKRLIVWKPVEREIPSINLDVVTFMAGDHRADRSSVFRATVDDVLALFFRWFDADKRRCAWPLQGAISMEGLKRVHRHYGQQMIQNFNKMQDELRQDEEKRKSKIHSVELYTQLGAVERRIASWFFDGNMFHKRGHEAFAIPKTLTETDVDFFRGLPFSLLHVTHRIYSSKLPASLRRLEKELALRGVNSLSKLLSRTNFFDLFVLLDIFDESFAQIDVLREYVAYWRKFRKGRLKPADIPRGSWKEKSSLEEHMTDPHRPRSEFPRCSTLKCTMRYSWQKTPAKNFEVSKQDVNSLKLLLIGSTGMASYPPEEGGTGWLHRVKRFFSVDTLGRTVQTMKAWHRKEKADAVLGLGDILGLPGPTSVQSELFETKWYNVFIREVLLFFSFLMQQGGLDVPWLMILGDNDAVMSPSTQIRYHYTRKHHNWHMPNDYYTATFQFGANLTLSEGATENEQFNTTVVNLNTWDLLAGNPVGNNMEGWTYKLHWLSDQLYTAAQKNSTWLIVTGHHPVISTGPEGEQARLQYVLDLHKNGQPRGMESRLVQLLFLHYQVDAYISSHDYLMEYVALKDKDNDVTVSFISSGAGARLLDYHLGQGWVGRLRGALYPALCWAGRKILFSLNPGGCSPLWRERDQPIRFFAPGQNSYEVDVVQRVTRKNGFVALKLSKDSMVVDFIDSNSGKPAAHSVHRKTNKAARAVRFLDPYTAGKVKYEELLLDREAFAKENKDLIEKEVEFYRRCPVLAARINLCVQEINGIVELYDELAEQKEGYEVMDDAGRDLMMAQGINVLTKTSQILGDMYTLANDYRKTELLYRKLVNIKKTEPTEDNPRWRELLDLEKRYATARRHKRDLMARLTADDAYQEEGVEKELEEEIRLMKLLRMEMDEIEADIERTKDEGGQDENAELGKGQQLPASQREKESALLEVKPLDTSLKARIERKEELLRRHNALLEELRTHPKSDLIELKPDVAMLKRQTAYIRQELTRLRQLLQRSQSPMLPSTVWGKFRVKEELESRLRQMKLYLFRVSRLPPAKRFSREVEAEVESVETEKAQLERDLTAVVDELGNRQLTPLQALYLAKESELLRNRQIAQLKYTLSAAELDMPEVEAALRKAEDRQNVLDEEVKKLHEQVMDELGKLDEEWRTEYPGADPGDDVLVGPGVEQLSADEVSKVLETGEVTKASAALQVLKSTKEYVSSLQEAVRLAKISSPEGVKEIERQWGPAEALEQKLLEAKTRVNELEETLKRMEGQLELEAPTNGKSGLVAGGAGRRRLEDIMSWFKEKREPTPYKKLERIDMGKTDPCMQMPFLEAAVKQVLQPEVGEEAKSRCVYELANQVYREQYRYIHPGVFFLHTATGMSPSLFDDPSVHVQRAYSTYFGYTHLSRFKCTLREIREGLDWIHKQVASLSLEDVKKLQEKNFRDTQEEETVPSGELDVEWSGEFATVDEATGVNS